MEISTLQIIAIFLFSCIAGMGSVLDEFQTHRPLIACTVIGLILGDLKTGIMLGGTLELIALGWMNVGAAQSPDSALASIISAILASDRLSLVSKASPPESPSRCLWLRQARC
ncbi:hypothetical protein EIMP300_03220 [Escherichia coli]|uniref:Sorbose-specific PTS system EIIC component n=1 Tax=Escherichia coli TaxID=562 RepID=A0A8S0FCL4_ECOLX|nr:hypothetical protein EIMP300_03220 [Escherichia coli]